MIALLAALVGGAFAQDTAAERAVVPDLDAQAFRASPDDAGLLVTDVASMPEQGGDARVLLSYHDDLLVYVSEGEQVGIVRNVAQANVIGAWGLGPVRIGLDVPVYLLARGDLTGQETGLGDVALDTRVSVFGREAPLSFPVDLGAYARISAPTATVANALGSGTPTWSVGLAGSLSVGSALIAANVGTRGGPATRLENVELNDALDWRVGVGYGLTARFDLSAEVTGRIGYAAPLTNLAGVPMEWLVGARAQLTEQVRLHAGVGRGLTPGIGSPDARAILGVGYAMP